MSATEVLRYSAFAATPDGGNPAGVVLDARGLGEADMLRIAQVVGYSETAFLTTPPSRPPTGNAPARATVRYFSPSAEVPFCGHATVATAVALAERLGPGPYVFTTPVGDVALATHETADGIRVSFVSVPPQVRDLDREVLAALLDVLGLREDDLRVGYPPKEAFAGNWHPVLVLDDREVFHQFRFHPPTLAALMQRHGWTGTVTVLSVLAPDRFEVRNLFVAGRITEDPATGSAAASVGAYLRQIGKVPPSGQVTICQGRHVGRPSILHVQIPQAGGIVVSGNASPVSP